MLIFFGIALTRPGERDFQTQQKLPVRALFGEAGVERTPFKYAKLNFLHLKWPNDFTS